MDDVLKTKKMCHAGKIELNTIIFADGLPAILNSLLANSAG